MAVLFVFLWVPRVCIDCNEYSVYIQVQENKEGEGAAAIIENAKSMILA